MSEQNKAVVRRFNEGLNDYFRTGDLSKLLDAVHPNVRFNLPNMPADLEGIKQVLPAFRGAFPDFHLTTSDMIAEGDLVAYRVSWTGTHKGELFGIPATGKTVKVTETHFDHVVSGKIMEHAGDWDQMGMMQQLGAIPVPGQAR